MNIKKILIISLSLVLLSACDSNNEASHESNEHGEADSHGHEEKKSGGHGGGGEHEEESGVVKFTDEQMKAADIEVTKLELQEISETIRAPGEVELNDYKTVKITPRINAQVIARHAVLGEKVVKGQPLITLSSVDMADVQGQLLVATREWNRVKKLGRKVVAERRYTEARANWKQLLTKARSYGMTQAQIDALTKDSKSKLADGTFQLLAPLAGRIIEDEFIIGELIEPGRILVSITDESVMWVEAHLNPNQAELISTGNSAEIVSGSQKLAATVTQVHHILDQATRTLAVRMEVENINDQLHAGMFVTAFILSNKKTQALVVPEDAVLRSSDGDWQIFFETEEKQEFKSQEVELVKIINGKAVITGIKPGTRVVTKGAFFVQSEIAKSGFEIHNH
ncbi:MAG: efflux RND transporter periplasmic adaptor subunit [Gammaproteobacteria bacterium]